MRYEADTRNDTHRDTRNARVTMRGEVRVAAEAIASAPESVAVRIDREREAMNAIASAAPRSLSTLAHARRVTAGAFGPSAGHVPARVARNCADLRGKPAALAHSEPVSRNRWSRNAVLRLQRPLGRPARENASYVNVGGARAGFAGAGRAA